ncbi:MAG: hypothetical protein AAGC90_13955 [Curtobacterium sp.]|uniref:hypothetical protein n=1 Tax=Curtobacterium sp. Curtsp57 TaxID=3243047 RepID=UPI0031A0DF4E
MSKQAHRVRGAQLESYWRRIFPGQTAHVHTDLLRFEERLSAYRAASPTERLEAIVVLTERSARARSSSPSTVLGAGVAAVAAFAGLMGTYTLFLLQSVVAVARDAQVRADDLVDAGRTHDRQPR